MIMCEPMPAAACLSVNTPLIGKSVNGTSEVAGMGSASVAHHHAVNNVIDAVIEASKLTLLNESNMNSRHENIGPSNKWFALMLEAESDLLWNL